MTWDEALNNSYLKDLPFKIEMSPASNRHGIIQSEIRAVASAP